MSEPNPTPFPLRTIPPAELNDRLREDLTVTTPELQHLLATSTTEQQEIFEFRERYDRLPANIPLAPRSLKAIHHGRSRYLALQGRLITLAKHYEAFLGLGADTTKHLDIDPVLRERAVLTSFVASLTLYDNYLSMRTVLEDDRLRRLITDPLRGYGQSEDAIRATLEDLNSPRRQKRLRDLVKGYDDISEYLETRHDPDIDLLRMAVESNAAYRHARHATLSKNLPTTSKLWRERVMDVLAGLRKGTLGTLSEVFGNGIGLVEFRKGKLWQNQKVEADLRNTLQPLDLLLEKTPFRLTDKFIPGHFGHVAVWVGSAKELDDLGIFDDPLFEDPRYRACETEVRAGHCVLEALRPGVMLSTPAEFLNVDDLAVLRPQGMSDDETRASLIRAFRQVGKQYDFNFEVETIDKITCSELPYHVFPDIPWETDQQFGQYTISPDQVAAQAFGEQARLRLVDFYHDGRQADTKDALPLMQRLVAAERADSP